MTKPYRPTCNGNASICNWNLSFRFYTKEQCQKFIKLLLKENMEYHFEYRVEHGHSIRPDQHWIEIHEHSWAKNLTKVAKLLEKVDYEWD